MAECINNIINNNVASGGTLNAADTSSVSASSTTSGVYTTSKTSSNGDVTFSNSYADAVSSAATKLANTISNASSSVSNTNCTDVILDFFSSQFPSATSVIKKTYDWTNNNLNIQSGINKLGNTLKGGELDKLTTQFCNTANNLYKTLVFYLDVATKAAIVIFKKIDALKEKIEKALLEFTTSVQDCLINVVIDAKSAVDKTVNNVLDFDSVLELMENCSCITTIVADMFDCTTDSSGTKMTDPNDVLTCVLEKYDLDASEIVSSINSFLDNSITDTIEKGFNLVDEFIQNTMELLIFPFRELIRLYVKLITTKINVTAIIRAIKPADCLLVYSKEYTSAGISYLGMSIIDMVNTLKSWDSCFEYACSSFVDDVTNKIKELNEDLRLDDKYWRSTLSIDLYQAAVGVEVESEQPRASMIREIFTKNQGTGKDIFTNLLDAFKQIGKITIDVGWNEESLGDTANAIKYKDGPDTETTSATENLLNNKKPISSVAETYIMSIETNLCVESTPYYVERFYELTDWVSAYKIRSKHTTQIETLLNTQQQAKSDFDTSQVSTTYESTGDREYYKGDNLDDDIDTITPSYELTDDYDETIINKIEDYAIPTKSSDETLQNYYKNWFAKAIA